MGGYEYSIELIKYLERTHCQNQLLFGKKHTTAERTSQTMADCKFSCQNKYSSLRWMDDSYSFCDKNRYTTSRDEWLQLEWWNK